MRKIYKINKGPKLPSNAMLVTIDAIGAYTNIPQKDGVECLKEALEERKDQTIPSEFIAKLMELLLQHNLFEFNSSTWRQKIGTAMGVHPAPNYANIYLSRRIDNKIKELSEKYPENGNLQLILFARFLDDIIQLFYGTTKELHIFFEEL